MPLRDCLRHACGIRSTRDCFFWTNWEDTVETSWLHSHVRRSFSHYV